LHRNLGGQQHPRPAGERRQRGGLRGSAPSVRAPAPAPPGRRGRPRLMTRVCSLSASRAGD
jgi:hypothetical protein